MEHPNTTDDLKDLIGIELVGARFHETYRLVDIQGHGSQAMAFRAQRVGATGVAEVVLKIFRPSFIHHHPEIAHMAFSKEWIALAQLNERVPPSPFIVRLLDGGDLAIRQGFQSIRLPWLALELVEGGPLGTTLRERVEIAVETSGFAFPPDRARKVLGCVFRGAQAIHEVGVVHRDLKPPNVLVCGAGPDELAKVSDFGVARNTSMGGTFGDFAVGTPGYAAPEQLENRDVGPWSDVFSLAAISYFTITGKPMFGGSRAMQMASAYAGKFTPLADREHVDHAFRQGDLLDGLNRIVAEGTNPDFRQRIPSVEELWRRLEPLLKGGMSHVTTTIDAMRTLHIVSPLELDWEFEVACRPPQSLGLRAVSFDPDGHALAAGAAGLFFWEGTRWLPVPPPPGLDPTAIRGLRRLGPRRWFACGDGGMVAVFSPEQCEWQQSVADGRVHFTALDVVSERTFALGGYAQPGGGPGAAIIYACLDGKWCAPLLVPSTTEIAALASIGLAHWAVVGSGSERQGVVFEYRALTGQLEPHPVSSAPLRGAAADPEGSVFAVGAGAYAFRMARGQAPVLERVMTQRDLGVVAVDPRGDVWAAGAGRILRRPGRLEDQTWSPVWSDADGSTPFVALGAMLGLIVAVDRHGSVVCGRLRGERGITSSRSS